MKFIKFPADKWLVNATSASKVFQNSISRGNVIVKKYAYIHELINIYRKNEKNRTYVKTPIIRRNKLTLFLILL